MGIGAVDDIDENLEVCVLTPLSLLLMSTFAAVRSDNQAAWPDHEFQNNFCVMRKKTD